MLLNPPSLNEIRIDLHLYIAVLLGGGEGGEGGGGSCDPQDPPPLDPAMTHTIMLACAYMYIYKYLYLYRYCSPILEKLLQSCTA